jgi:hypothetical protein
MLSAAEPDQHEAVLIALRQRGRLSGRLEYPDTEIASQTSRVFGQDAPTRLRPREIESCHFLTSRLCFIDGEASVFARSVRPCPCAGSVAAVMVVSISPFMGALLTQPRMDGSGPRDGCASIAFPQRLRRLFSPAAKWRHSSRGKKAGYRRPSLCCGPVGCGPIAPRAKDRHRGCDGRGPTTDGDHHGYHRHLHCVE